MKFWLISLLVIQLTTIAHAEEKKIFEAEIDLTHVTPIVETAIESALQPPQLKAMRVAHDWACEDDGCAPQPSKKKMRHVRVFKPNRTCDAWGFGGFCDVLGIRGDLIREYDEEIK